MTKRITVKDLIGFNLKPKHLAFLIEYVKDFDARRAAVVTGHAADTGYQLVQNESIAAAMELILQSRMELSHIDAEWLLWELVDNHTIARQSGNITASNTALSTIAKHVSVDAFAAAKIDVSSDREMIERLDRGRARVAQGFSEADEDDTVVEEPQEISFL